MKFKTIIGLEIHIQIKTSNKMFSTIPYKYGIFPNQFIDPLILGLPGSLPIINLEAIYQTIKIGLMLNCQIAQKLQFDRKNYFYPDLSKGYQISQYYYPLCKKGVVEIEMPNNNKDNINIKKYKKIRLERIHLEEDVGKLIHQDDFSLIDFNRGGIPLMEIVTKPDLNSSNEVVNFINTIKSYLKYLGISTCNMEKGEMRFDLNISMKSETIIGEKVEIKNLNTISQVHKIINNEITRQQSILKTNKNIQKETIRWIDSTQELYTLRKKEDNYDYRYFPDPDIIPLFISHFFIKKIKNIMPIAPLTEQKKYYKYLNIAYNSAYIISNNQLLNKIFQFSIKFYNHPKNISNLMINEFIYELKKNITKIQTSLIKIRPKNIGQIVSLIHNNKLSKQLIKKIFNNIFFNGKMITKIFNKYSYPFPKQIDSSSINIICKNYILSNKCLFKKFKYGKQNVLNVLKGNIIKNFKSKVNPKFINEFIIKHFLY